MSHSGELDRFAFYKRAKKAFAVVSTGERRLYGNIIVSKGVIRERSEQQIYRPTEEEPLQSDPAKKSRRHFSRPAEATVTGESS